MSLSALALVHTNPQAAAHLRQFRNELAQAKSGAGTYAVHDHWLGVVRGLQMAGSISQASRDQLESAIRSFAEEQADRIIQRLRAVHQVAHTCPP